MISMSETRITKRSKSTEQVTLTRKLDSADYLPLLRCFTPKPESIRFPALVKKTGLVFLMSSLVIRV